jgi:membrane protein
VGSPLKPVLRRIEPVLRRLAPLLERIASVGLVQSAVVLAAQAFMALFPLLIAVTAIAPPRVGQTLSAVAHNRLGLTGNTGADVQRLVATRADLRGGLSVLGALVVLASATSFTRALQRIYENAWQLPRLGLRGSFRGVAWLLGLVVYFVVIGLAFRLTASPAPAVSLLRLVLVGSTGFGLWWMTPFLLLCGRVRARALLLTGALTTAGLIAAAGVSTKVLPGVIRSNERQFGTIGVVFAIQSWLVALGGLIVAAAILGALLMQTRPPGTWQRQPRPLRRRRAPRPPLPQ